MASLKETKRTRFSAAKVLLSLNGSLKKMILEYLDNFNSGKLLCKGFVTPQMVTRMSFDPYVDMDNAFSVLLARPNLTCIEFPCNFTLDDDVLQLACDLFPDLEFLNVTQCFNLHSSPLTMADISCFGCWRILWRESLDSMEARLEVFMYALFTASSLRIWQELYMINWCTVEMMTFQQHVQGMREPSYVYHTRKGPGNRMLVCVHLDGCCGYTAWFVYDTRLDVLAFLSIADGIRCITTPFTHVQYRGWRNIL